MYDNEAPLTMSSLVPNINGVGIGRTKENTKLISVLKTIKRDERKA